jgi:hypothetical protein
MNEDNAPAGKLEEKYEFFFFILKVTEERSRIGVGFGSICQRSRSGSAPKCHGSPILLPSNPARQYGSTITSLYHNFNLCFFLLIFPSDLFKVNLRKHELAVHEEPGRRDHPCGACSKRFKNAGALSEHLKTHDSSRRSVRYPALRPPPPPPPLPPTAPVKHFTIAEP